MSDWPVYSRGGTRTRDPGIMRAGSLPLGATSPLSPSYTYTHQNTPNRTRFGTRRGTADKTAEDGGQGCVLIPERGPRLEKPGNLFAFNR